MVKSSKKVKNTFSNFNLFENLNLNDHCWTDNGVKVEGPGLICWSYIILVIVVNFVSLKNIGMFKEMGLSNTQIAVRYFFQFLYMFLSMTFMYSMCKRCRGLEGFLILLLLGFISTVIALGPLVRNLLSDVQNKVKQASSLNNKDSDSKKSDSKKSDSKKSDSKKPDSKEGFTDTTTSPSPNGKTCSL